MGPPSRLRRVARSARFGADPSGGALGPLRLALSLRESWPPAAAGSDSRAAALPPARELAARCRGSDSREAALVARSVRLASLVARPKQRGGAGPAARASLRESWPPDAVGSAIRVLRERAHADSDAVAVADADAVADAVAVADEVADAVGRGRGGGGADARSRLWPRERNLVLSSPRPRRSRPEHRSVHERARLATAAARGHAAKGRQPGTRGERPARGDRTPTTGATASSPPAQRIAKRFVERGALRRRERTPSRSCGCA